MANSLAHKFATQPHGPPLADKHYKSMALGWPGALTGRPWSSCSSRWLVAYRRFARFCMVVADPPPKRVHH